MEEFDAETMLADLERQLRLSSEELAKLKPALDAKSKELKKSINESVDGGFLELEALTSQLDAASKKAQAQLKESFSSEEMQRLRDYLQKIDKEAITQATDELVAQLTTFLKLTETQILELKPTLEEAFNQLGDMLSKLAQEGSKSLEEFKKNYESLSEELRQNMESTLDREQIKLFNQHRQELRENIEASLFST
jgi:hypothetical protein